MSESLQRLRQLARSCARDLHIDAGEYGVDIELAEPALRFRHSFVSGPIEKRARQGQLLLKACNNKQRSIRRILDLTAGWGIDAFILARHGHEVTMLEQDALLQAIVAHSLRQLARTPEGAETAGRMALEQANARHYLEDQAKHDFDCIYLDPMFDAHKSGARPAKEMQILQALTGNLDIECCFQQALSSARKRVVVKRAARAAPLVGLKPDLVQRARTIRFDIYLTA